MVDSDPVPTNKNKAASIVYRVLAALLLLNGCASHNPPVASSHSGREDLPGGVKRILQDGDIILTRAAHPVSALIAAYGANPGPFSHAGLYCRNRDAEGTILHMELGGMQNTAVNDYLNRYARAVIMRHAGRDVSSRLGANARKWLDENARSPAEFALDIARNSRKANQFNCNGLINMIYAQSKLTEPFQIITPAPDNAWSRLADKSLNIDFRHTPTANSIFQNPDFHQVATWENPQTDPDELTVTEVVAEMIHSEIMDGSVPRKPTRPGTRFVSCLARSMARASTGQSRQLELRAMLMDYTQLVNTHVQRAKRSTPPGEWSAQQVRKKARSACQKYLGRFFTSPSNPDR